MQTKGWPDGDWIIQRPRTKKRHRRRITQPVLATYLSLDWLSCPIADLKEKYELVRLAMIEHLPEAKAMKDHILQRRQEIDHRT